MTQTIYFCTTNPGKKKKLETEFHTFLPKISLEIIDFSIHEIQNFDTEIIAQEKVKSVFMKIQKPCLSLDSGLYIHSLKNFPGAYIKPILDTIGIDGIIKLLENYGNRDAEIRNSLAFFDGQNIQVFTEKIFGKIANQPSENIKNNFSWSELSKIFIPKDAGKTLAELSNEEFLEWNSTRNTNGILKQFSEFYKNLP